MRCAACSTPTQVAAQFCDQCGAAVFATSPAVDASDATHPPVAYRGVLARAALGGIAVALLVSGLILVEWVATPSATPHLLHAAMDAAISRGEGPGMDPICVANGLSYDADPVNVHVDNAATLAWMNTLVSAGLYDAPEDSVSGGFFSRPIRVYRPLPALAPWGGGRRLCIARAVRLLEIANLGRVEPIRVRGKSYTGLPADLHWALDQPAPWLDTPGVGEVIARELPAWRGARWQRAPDGWRLTQRKSFVQIEKQWLPGDMIDKSPVNGASKPRL